MQMVMTPDETQIQILANWPMSHVKRVTRDSWKNPEYRAIATIRKLRTDKLSRRKIMAKPCKKWAAYRIWKDLRPQKYCKEVCDVNPGIDPYPFLTRSCARWWPDFLTFTACKKSRFGFKRDRKAQRVSDRCKDLLERKNILGLGAL